MPGGIDPPSGAVAGAIALVSGVVLSTARTVKLRVTDAGAWFASPAWAATMVHVPGPTMVTVVPETVHTSGVGLVYEIGRPESDVAASSKLPLPSLTFGRAGKSITWSAWAMSNVVESELAL